MFPWYFINLILKEQNDQQEMYTVVKKELDTLKNKHKEIIEELNTWKDKVSFSIWNNMKTPPI